MIDSLIAFFATYFPFMLIALVCVWAVWPKNRIRTAIVALIASGIARFGVKPFMLLFIQRARPDGSGLDSFPSGHALFFFALAMVIYRHDKRWGAAFFAGALLMGIARVFAGFHYSTDILAGAALGMLVGWCIDKIYVRFCH